MNIYLEWKKEIITNYKFKKADKYHKHHKIQKSNNILLISCLTMLYKIFFLHFLAAYILIAFSYDNDIVISFSMERLEK